MSRLAGAAAAVAVAALAGCAPGGLFDEVISQVDHASAYRPNETAAFAAAGPLVELHGPLPGGASPSEVVAALRMPGFFPQTPFALAPDPPLSARPMRVALAFGPGGVDPDGLCAGRVPSGEGAPGLGVAAALCRGPAPFGWGRLDHARPLAPPDPAFGQAMTRLLASVAPPRHPNDPRSDGRGCIVFC